MIHLFGLDAAAADLRRAQMYRRDIISQARAWNIPSALVAAIGSRETHWDEDISGPGTFWLGDPQKMAGGSLHYHGCGPLQVDDRTDAVWCAEWRAGKHDVEEGIRRGLQELCAKIADFRARKYSERDVLKLSIAAYNCGQNNVIRCLVAGIDVDHYTMPHDGRTGAQRNPWRPGDYSRDVFERQKYFAEHGFSSIEGSDSWGGA